MKSLAPRYLAAVAASVVALSCGDVPTLDSGISYVTPIILPSPAVAAGDVLRDSLGNPAPLQVLAYDNNNVVIPTVTANYVITSLPAGVTIDSSGRVTALDSVRTVTIVARVGSRIQTTAATLEVVAQPDSVERTALPDSLVSFTKTGVLSVKISALFKGTRIPVKGILVRYRIIKINGSLAIDTGSHTLVDDANTPLRIDARRAVDTTDASGSAARYLVPVSLTGVDSIVVEARASSLRGVPLKGSPVRFVLPVKKGS